MDVAVFCGILFGAVAELLVVFFCKSPLLIARVALANYVLVVKVNHILCSFKRSGIAKTHPMKELWLERWHFSVLAHIN